MSDCSPDFGRGSGADGGGTPGGAALALSAAQLGIWFAQKLNPASPAYNIGEYMEIDGAVDEALFGRALAQLIAEADVLRIRIDERSGEPCQMIGAAGEWSLPVFDVSRKSDPRAAAESWMRDDLARARRRRTADGVELELLDGQESHMIVRAAVSDALVLLPRGEGVLPAGTRVRYLRLD